MRKKIMVGVLLMGITSMVACSGTTPSQQTIVTTEATTEEVIQAEAMELGKYYTIDDKVKLRILKTMATEKEESLLGSRATTYFKQQGETNFDVVIEAVNLTDTSAAPEDLITMTALKEGEEDLEEAGLIFSEFKTEIKNYTELTTERELEPGIKNRIHCIIAVDDDEAEDYKIQFGEEKQYEFVCNSLSVQFAGKRIKKGESLKFKNHSEITLKKVYYTNKLEPSKPENFYQYLENKDEEKKLLVAKFEVVNRTSKKKPVSDLIVVNAYSLGIVDYGLQCLVEKLDGSNFSETIGLSTSGNSPLEPNEKYTVYAVTYVPASWEESDQNLYIATKGAEYKYVKKAKE